MAREKFRQIVYREPIQSITVDEFGVVTVITNLPDGRTARVTLDKAIVPLAAIKNPTFWELRTARMPGQAETYRFFRNT